MANWEQKPTWNKMESINGGSKYVPADGVTADDMNKMLENVMYLKKYGSRINVLSASATVQGTILKFTSEEA